ncbi:hypothetical protein [Paraburkholderia saeva]|uniref:hypothetical protein n=1 Tax=Paraburkholderia saeva TaxID=2777537 RepID=UPI001E562DE0|nr:hypothetical protein [Paraburkholderia saeva]
MAGFFVADVQWRYNVLLPVRSGVAFAALRRNMANFAVIRLMVEKDIRVGQHREKRPARNMRRNQTAAVGTQRSRHRVAPKRRWQMDCPGPAFSPAHAEKKSKQHRKGFA